MNSFTKVIEKEEELQKLALDGENLISYFNETPEKKQAMIEKYYRFRDEIADDDIPNAYKDSMLEAINKYLHKLESNYLENKSDSLLCFILGSVAGAMGMYGLDKLMKSFEEKVSNGIVDGIHKGMGKL